MRSLIRPRELFSGLDRTSFSPAITVDEETQIHGHWSAHYLVSFQISLTYPSRISSPFPVLFQSCSGLEACPLLPRQRNRPFSTAVVDQPMSSGLLTEVAT